jgi:3-hydroxybutyryl-CoA dehydrogenase
MKNIAVIGGGTMGTGIAYVAALDGAEVMVVEPQAERVQELQRAVEQAAAAGVKRGKLDSEQAHALVARIRCVTDIAELPMGMDLAIETVPERLELKQQVLRQLSERQPQIIGTNTSALSIDTLAKVLPEPENFLGMHFFNPVWSIRLVELIRGQATAESTLARVREFVTSISKESLTVIDVPGFATSRLDLVAGLEAMRMLESGVASAEDIDRAAVLAYQHPVGPLRLSDIVGLDVRLDIARVLEKAHGPQFAPPAILIEMVERGTLGKKSGKGFFSWEQ